MTYTYTYVILEISPAAYYEIKRKLEEAGYHHVFHEEQGTNDKEPSIVIDMHGIALKEDKDSCTTTSQNRPRSKRPRKSLIRAHR